MAAGILYQQADVYFDWLCTRENPHTGRMGYVNLQKACARMKRVALSEEYDYVWIVESDTVPPLDALDKLLDTARETDAELVTGLYVLRHGAHVPNLFTWGGTNLGSAFEWRALAALAERSNTVQVSGGCMGCVLIHPDALDFEFEIWKTDVERPYAAPDMEWMRHNLREGYKTMARLDVMCDHIETDGNILRAQDFLK